MEAWRRLVQHNDPYTSHKALDRVGSILNRQKCKKVKDLQIAVEIWERDWREYVSRSASGGSGLHDGDQGDAESEREGDIAPHLLQSLKKSARNMCMARPPSIPANDACWPLGGA